MKKGFTLIELLAVIVILAIIALIATPIILNIIDDASKSSSKISMDNLDYAVDLYYQRKELNGPFKPITFICKDGICTSGTETLEIEGNGIQRGIISIDSNGNATYTSMLINGYKCNIVNKEATCEIGSESTVTSETNEIVITGGNSNALNNYKIYGSSSGVGEASDSGYIVPVTVRGKNLFNGNLTVEDSFNYGNGSLNNYNLVASDFISVDFDSSAYKLSGLLNTIYSMILSYDSNNELVSRTNGSIRLEAELPTNFSTTYSENDIEYIRFIQYEVSNTTGSVSDVYNQNIQLEKGTTPTTYEPYRTPTTHNITLSSPLMSGDYIDFETQSVVRSNGTIESVNLPVIYSLDVNTTILEVNTSNLPSKIEVSYIK